VGSDLNTLVNSDILPNLCPAPDPKYFPDGIKTAWTKPGRAVWRYVDGGDGSFEGLKGFSRMAGELGFEYHILEGVWSRWSDEQIKEIVEYSRQRGVRLLFWKHSNQLRTPEARDAFFTKLQGLGVAGAKIDFFDHEAKEVIDLYEELLRNAAEHKMVLDFHGANKPTGRSDWPNDMIRKTVRGWNQRDEKQPGTKLSSPLPATAGHAAIPQCTSASGKSTWSARSPAGDISRAMLTIEPIRRACRQSAVEVIEHPGGGTASCQSSPGAPGRHVDAGQMCGPR
jgi:hypothetical protein